MSDHTDALPTVPGVYWSTCPNGDARVIVQVDEHRGKLVATTTDLKHYRAGLDKFSEWTNWRGPIIDDGGATAHALAASRVECERLTGLLCRLLASSESFVAAHFAKGPIHEVLVKSMDDAINATRAEIAAQRGGNGPVG